jgi:hypothetical protein
MAEFNLESLLKKALDQLMKRDSPKALEIAYKGYKHLDKASKNIQKTMTYEDELEQRLAQADKSDVAFKHCDNKLLKKLYLVTVDLVDKPIDPAWERQRNAASWRESLSQSIWGSDSLTGFGEFGPQRKQGEALSDWYKRRALGARNSIAEIQQIIEQLWALQDYFDSAADVGSHAEELGIATAVIEESSVGLSCGMLAEELGKKAHAGGQRVNKILDSMNGLVPSLEDLATEFDDGLNSLAPRAETHPSGPETGPGKSKDAVPLGRFPSS